MHRVFAMSLLAVILPAALNAQRMSSGPHFAAQRSAHSFGGDSGHFADRRSLAYPPGFFYDSFYDDALLSSGYPVASQPPVIVMQYPPPADSQPQPDPTPMQPLMIELQGGRYVRVSGDEDSRSEIIDGEALRPEMTGPEVTVRHEPPATLLVFRDGHREQVNDYTIADGMLYARGNFYSDGAWTRKIGLSALNLPETIKANQSRGLRFRLPTASNEVIIGP